MVVGSIGHEAGPSDRDVDRPRWRWPQWLGVAISFVVLGVAAFAPWRRTAFIADDYDEVWKAMGRASSIPAQQAGSNFRPLHTASLWVDFSAHGLNPVMFGFTNVVLHVIASLLVVSVCLALVSVVPSLSRLPGRTLAITAGLIFLVAPSRSEPVAWVAARADLLVTVWCLVSLLMWLQRRDRSRWWTVASLAAFAAALGSKESAVVFPVVITLVELLRQPRGTGRLRCTARAVWPFYAVLVPYTAVRWIRISGAPDGYGLQSLIGPVTGWPVRLAAVVVRSFVPGMPIAAWVGCAVVAVVVGYVVWRGSRRDGIVGSQELGLAGLVACAAVVVLAAPSAGLGVSASDTQGERLTYLPGAPAALLVAGVLTTLLVRSPRWGRFAIGSCVLVSLGVLMVINQRWVASSEMAAQFVRAEREWPADSKPILVTLPDSVQGAFSGRNALAASLVTEHEWREPYRAASLSSYAAASPGSFPVVRTGGADRTWIIELGPNDEWVTVAGDGEDQVIGVTVRRVDDRHLHVSAASDDIASRLWVFDEAGMRRLSTSDG